MVAEIVAGTLFGSMALVADGWHMSTHAAALVITAFRLWLRAAACARSAFHLRHGQARRSRGFASALSPRADRPAMGWESGGIADPGADRFRPGHRRGAVSASSSIWRAPGCWRWRHVRRHGHHGGSEHRPTLTAMTITDHGDHAHRAHDSGQQYPRGLPHVIADALTSVPAIAALTFGSLLWLGLA